MKRAASVVFFLAVWIGRAVAEFNQCLGTEIYRLPTMENCARLYAACQVGVRKLNTQLHVPPHGVYHAVCLVSATESKARSSKETMVAMLVQLAPVEYCSHSNAAPQNSSLSGERCTFDMAKMEIYSMLLQQEHPGAAWTLEGYKHHAVSDDDRAQIVTQYNSGHFFGSNLAIGIFETPNLPAQNASDSADRGLARSPVVVFAALASATVTVGLLFHQRRRLHNGYAPIIVIKREQPQAKSLRRPTSADAQLGARAPLAATDGRSSSHETPERFAV